MLESKTKMHMMLLQSWVNRILLQMMGLRDACEIVAVTVMLMNV